MAPKHSSVRAIIKRTVPLEESGVYLQILILSLIDLFKSARAGIAEKKSSYIKYSIFCMCLALIDKPEQWRVPPPKQASAKLCAAASRESSRGAAAFEFCSQMLAWRTERHGKN